MVALPNCFEKQINNASSSRQSIEAVFLALPYQWIDFDDFYLADPSKSPSDPDALTSRRGDGSQTLRDGFGSTIFRYTRCMPQAFYDPISGSAKDDAPARALMYTYITRWMRDFRVDGVRMDSVENVANWDFVGGFKDRARNLWNERWQAAGLGPAGADDRFLVIGEELSRPLGLLSKVDLTDSGMMVFARAFALRFWVKAMTVRTSNSPCAMPLTAAI